MRANQDPGGSKGREIDKLTGCVSSGKGFNFGFIIC